MKTIEHQVSNDELYLKLGQLNLFGEVILSNTIPNRQIDALISKINGSGQKIRVDKLPDGRTIVTKINNFSLSIYKRGI